MTKRSIEVNFAQLEELFDSTEELEGDLKMFKAVKALQTMSLGEEGVEYLAERYDFKPYLYNFIEFNPSHQAPYHNRYHTYCMVLNCFEGAITQKFSHNDTRALLIAALYHDFDHTAGRELDEVNIKRAQVGFEIAHKYATATGCTLSNGNFWTVKRLIEVTKYPFEEEPDTLLKQIIRDADLMQVYEEDKLFLRAQFLGLRDEIAIKRGPMTNQEFAQGYVDWYRKEAVFYTVWGLEKAATSKLQDRLDNLKELLSQ